MSISKSKWQPVEYNYLLSEDQLRAAVNTAPSSFTQPPGAPELEWCALTPGLCFCLPRQAQYSQSSDGSVKASRFAFNMPPCIPHAFIPFLWFCQHKSLSFNMTSKRYSFSKSSYHTFIPCASVVLEGSTDDLQLQLKKNSAGAGFTIYAAPKDEDEENREFLQASGCCVAMCGKQTCGSWNDEGASKSYVVEIYRTPKDMKAVLAAGYSITQMADFFSYIHGKHKLPLSSSNMAAPSVGEGAFGMNMMNMMPSAATGQVVEMNSQFNAPPPQMDTNWGNVPQMN